MSYNPNDGSVYTKYQLIELLAPHKLRATCSIRITCISMTKYELLALHNQFINGAKVLLLKNLSTQVQLFTSKSYPLHLAL